MTTDRDDRYSDDELVRYIDGELDDADADALRARVADAPETAHRLDTLRRRSHGLAALLAHVDPDQHEIRQRADLMRQRLHARVAEAEQAAETAEAAEIGQATPSRRIGRSARGGPSGRARFAWSRPTPALQAAAVVLLLLAGAFAVPPARAWVVDRVRDVAEALGLAAPVAPAVDPDHTGPAGPAGADMAVTFTVTGETFDIHLTRPAALLVERGTGTTGSAEADAASADDAASAPGPAAAASFVVLPGGLRVDGASPGSTVRVTLPPTVTAVRVRVGDAPATTHTMPGVGETLRLGPPDG